MCSLTESKHAVNEFLCNIRNLDIDKEHGSRFLTSVAVERDILITGMPLECHSLNTVFPQRGDKNNDLVNIGFCFDGLANSADALRSVMNHRN